MRASITLIRVLARTAGLAALQRGLALYLSIAIFAFVIFAGNGLNASTVVHAAEGAPWLRLILLATWTLATLPVARAILVTPETFFLRSLPVPRWRMLVVFGAFLALAELPWVVVFVRGGGWLLGFAALTAATAAHTLWIAGRMPAAQIGLAAVGLSWAAAPVAARAAVSTTALAVGLLRAWRLAPEGPRGSRSSPLPTPAVLALTVAYALISWRRHGVLLVRACLITASAGLFAFALLRNNDDMRDELGARVALSLFIPAVLLSATTFAAPMIECERNAEWVLSTCGTSTPLRRNALAALLALGGAGFGLAYAAPIGLALNVDLLHRLRFVLLTALVGGVSAAAVEATTRWALRERGRDSGRLILSLSLATTAAEGAVWLARERWLALTAGYALLGVAIFLRWPDKAARPLC
jgi:hypothetical protein